MRNPDGTGTIGFEPSRAYLEHFLRVYRICAERTAAQIAATAQAMDAGLHDGGGA